MSDRLIVNVLLKLQDEYSEKLYDSLERNKKDLDSFAKHAKKTGDELISIGKQAALAGAAITGLIGGTVKQFADQEAALANLKSTLTGKDGLSANFQAISDLAVKLGNQLPGNTADFAAMVNKLLQLGITEEAVLGGVGEAAAKLAAVLKLPYEEAAMIAAKLKEATGTADADMLKFMDTIQRVAHQGVSAAEMMEAFRKSGGALKSFGIQGEEAARQVSSIFAQLLKSGVSGETAGTGLAAVFNRLTAFETESIAGPENAKAMLKGLGIELEFFDKKTQEFKGVENMIAEFSKLQQLGELQRANVLQEWFGGGQDQQIVSMLAQGGTAANEAMQQRMAEQADLASRSAVQLQTLTAKWEAAMGNFQNMLAKIGEQLAPTVGKFVDWFGETSMRIAEWVDQNKGVAETVGLVLSGLGAGLTAIGAAGLAAGAIAKAFGAVATGLSLLAPLAANPVVLAILGIGAAGVAGWKLGSWINEQLNSVAEALTGVKGASLGTAFADLIDWITLQFDEIPKAVRAKFDAAVAYVKGLPERLKTLAKDAVQGFIDGINAKVSDVIKTVTDLAGLLPDWVQKKLKMQSPSLVMQDIGLQAAQGFALGINLGIPLVSQAAQGLASAAAGAAGGVGGVVAANDVSGPTEYHRQMERLETEHQQRLFDIRSFFESAAFNNATRYRQLNLDSAGFFFSQLGALMQTESRTMFEIGKAAAIGETIINTYKAAQLAYAALAGIPIVGPALGVAAAAAAVASGLARVSAIKSTKFGTTSGTPVLSGGGFSGPVVSSGTGVSVPPTPVNAVPGQGAAVAAPRVVNLFLRGTDVYSASAVRDQLVPALNEALGDGVTLNVRAA